MKISRVLKRHHTRPTMPLKYLGMILILDGSESGGVKNTGKDTL